LPTVQQGGEPGVEQKGSERIEEALEEGKNAGCAVQFIGISIFELSFMTGIRRG
jgi:hypothetical protein